MTSIPEGFVPHERTSPLTAPWEPIYGRRTNGRHLLAVQVRVEHTNSRGLVHGGMIAALVDNAMGLSLAEQLRISGRMVDRGPITTSLSVDYLDRAGVDDWLWFVTGFVHVGRRTGNTEALVTAGERVVARANATFALS